MADENYGSDMGMDLELNIDTPDEMSAKEMEEVLGTEHVNESEVVITTESAPEVSSSAEKLKDFKKKQKLQEEAKKKAKEQKMLAEERARRSTVERSRAEMEHSTNHEASAISYSANSNKLTSSSNSGATIFDEPVIEYYGQKPSFTEDERFISSVPESVYEEAAEVPNTSYRPDPVHVHDAYQESSSPYRTEQPFTREESVAPITGSLYRHDEWVPEEAPAYEPVSYSEHITTSEEQHSPSYESEPVYTRSFTESETTSQYTNTRRVEEQPIYQTNSSYEAHQAAGSYDTPMSPESRNTTVNIRDIDTKNGYMVQPEHMTAGAMFEHTGNPIAVDSVQRTVAGTITDAGVFVGCNIIVDNSADEGGAFNSRMESAVLQPMEKPAEDPFRLSVDVNIEDIDNGNLLGRRTADVSFGGRPSAEKPLVEVTEEQIAEKLPKTVDTSLLYQCSQDMDSSHRPSVIEMPDRSNAIIGGPTEVRTSTDSGFSVPVSTIGSPKANASHSVNVISSVENSTSGLSTTKDLSEKVAGSGSKESVKSGDVSPAFGASETEKKRDVIASADKKEAVDKESPVSTETREAETKDARQIQSAAKRKFVRENGQMWKDICSAGQTVFRAVGDQLTPEDDAAVDAYMKGKGFLKEVGDHISFIGARNTHEMVVDKATKVYDASRKAETLITKTPTLTLTDLSLKNKDLKRVLKENGASKSDIKRILKYKDSVKTSLESKQLLLDFAAGSNGQISDNMVNFLKGTDVFNTTLFSTEFTSVASKYFSSSTDPLFKAINPASMTPKELRNLLKKADKMGVTAKDKALIQALYDNKVAGRAKAMTAYAAGVKGRLSQLSKLFNKFADKLGDDASAVGFRQAGSIVNTGKSAFSMMRLSGRVVKTTLIFGGRVIFLNPASRYIGRQIKKQLNVIKNTAKTAIKSTEIAKKATKAAGSAKKAVGQNKKIQALKQKVTGVQKKISKANTTRKNISRKLKKAGNRAGRIVKAPVKFVTAPFRAVSMAFNKVKEFIMKKLLLPVAGVGVVIILIAFILVILSTVLSAVAKSGETKITLSNDDMKELVAYVDEKTEEQYNKALEKALGTPLTNTVYDGIPLRCFGSPQSYSDPTSEYYHHEGVTIDKSLLNGWHIYYLDSNGDILGEETSNVKDIICLASVMMGNQSNDLGEYKNMVDDMWPGMVPHIVTAESDIYHSIYSSDTYPFDDGGYKCNDSSFYTKYETSKNNGVCFYETPEPQNTTTPSVPGYNVSGTGCVYDEWFEWKFTCPYSEHSHGSGCNSAACSHSCDETCEKDGCTHSHSSACCSMSTHTHSAVGGSCYEKEWYREYRCDGHYSLHCSYGYVDVNIYITLLKKEDVYRGTPGENSISMEYLVPSNFEATSFDTATSTINYQVHLDGYRRRMKKFLNKGGWDFSDHISLSTFNSALNRHMCTGIDRCAGAIEWCDNLYNADWHSMYGVMVDGVGGTGIDYVLSDEQRSSYLELAAADFEGISDERLTFIDFALQNVGQINYWWGGKPESAGWNDKWGTRVPASDTYYSSNAAHGRLTYGLDAAGFVGWVYWSTFGVQPNCSTKSLVHSLNLTPISSNELMPGDIGCEELSGATENHFGIFIGYDDKGKELWAHCNPINGNVAINNTNGFYYYYKLQ